MDHDDDVLYCYEIQLEECVRRKGLGSFFWHKFYKLDQFYREIHDESAGTDDAEIWSFENHVNSVQAQWCCQQVLQRGFEIWNRWNLSLWHSLWAVWLRDSFKVCSFQYNQLMLY